MTVQTAHLIKEWPVYPVFAENVIHHIAVAASAQFIPRPLALKRGGGIRRFMALAA